MADSIRVSTSALISGALVVGDAGHGVLGSEVPSTGDNGPGYLYNDLTLPADAGKEVRGEITAWPLHGNLVAYEDSSFIYTPNLDYVGTDSFSYQLYVDGIATGSPTTVTLTITGDTQYITVDRVLQDNSVTGVAIKQSHKVAVGNAVQAINVSPVYAGQTAVHSIVAANINQSASATPVSVAQVHLVSVGDASQSIVVSGVSVGFSAMTLTDADIQAIVAALQAAILPVNIVQVNYGPVDGDGSDGNPWGPV